MNEIASMPALQPIGERLPSGRWDQVELWLLALLIAIEVGFLVFIAWNARRVMDEFAQGYLGHTLEDGLYRAVDPSKTALPQVLFSLPLHGDLSSGGIHHGWRLMTLSAVLGVIILAFLMARLFHTCGAAAHSSVPIRDRRRGRAPGMHQLE